MSNDDQKTIRTLGELIRKDDVTLAFMIVNLLHLKDIKETGEMVAPKEEIVYWLEKLKMPCDPSKAPPWMN